MTLFQTDFGKLPQTLRRNVSRLLGITPDWGLLPRKHCHYLTLPLRGVPAKHIEAAIRLHLQQLGRFAQTGFAYRQYDNLAHIWYWDDGIARTLFRNARVQPCPEPLLRPPMASGLRLCQCEEGFDLEGQTSNGLYKSRWFANMPNADEQALFSRDLGLHNNTSIETPEQATLNSAPNHDWTLYSSLAPRVPLPLIAALLLLIGAGALASWQASRLAKIEDAIQQSNRTLEQLRQQRGQITSLEGQIADLAPLHEALAAQYEHPQQIELLAALAASQIVGDKSGAWLTGWVYQKDGITLTIRLGENSRRADILARLEAAARVSELMLMPDPPTGSMVVRLRLNNTPRATPASQPDVSNAG